MRRHLPVVGLLVVLATGAHADMQGKPEVVDGETIAIAGAPIRFFGIEAPAADQSCMRSGQTWPCGRDATFALAFELAEHWVSCKELGRDSVGRILAACVMGPYDVAAHMVRLGWARARREESQAYVQDETEARARRAGIWQGDPPPGW